MSHRSFLLICLIIYDLVKQVSKQTSGSLLQKKERSKWGYLLRSWNFYKMCDIECMCVILRVCVCVCVPSPAQCPEPGQVVGVVHTVTDGDDFMEALDLNTEDLHRETLRHQGRTCVCGYVPHPAVLVTQNGWQAYFQGVPWWQEQRSCSFLDSSSEYAVESNHEPLHCAHYCKNQP